MTLVELFFAVLTCFALGAACASIAEFIRA
jgi:hypothetical protein